MTHKPQIAVEFANSVRNFLCRFLIDSSGSMTQPTSSSNPESRWDGLMRGLAAAITFFRGHPTYRHSVRLAYTSIGDPIHSTPHVALDDFVPPAFGPNGATPLGAAIHRAIDDTLASLHQINDAGGSWQRPAIVLISDGAPFGEPDDYVNDAIARLRDLVVTRRMLVVPVGVTQEDKSRLDSLGFGVPAYCVEGLSWAEVIVAASASAGGMAAGQAPLPNLSPSKGQTP